MSSSATTRTARAALLTLSSLVFTGLLLGACESNKNYDERRRFAEANGFVDDELCVGTCIEYDPPSPLTERECADAEAGLEFVRIWDFDVESSCPDGYGVSSSVDAGVRNEYCVRQFGEGPAEVPIVYPAPLLFQYSDGTGDFRLPLKPDPNRNYELVEAGWEPNTQGLERCQGEGGRVLHISGGPYEAWGGGMGRTLVDNWTSAQPEPGTSIESKIDWRCAAPDHADDRCMGLDLSEWEGISFWAARGPDSQPGIRVMVGDWKADDDWSYLQDVFDDPEPRQCYRAKECGCDDGKPCTVYAGEQYCFDPAVDPDPVTTDTYETCGETECRKYAATFEPNLDDTIPNSEVDPRFAESECVEYTYRTGLTDTLCYSEGVDRKPPESDQKCGDHWASPVRLSREWKFYTVPFGDLLQQGWAKEFPKPDLSNVTTFRFTYGRGWIDYYLDKVSFYRKKPVPANSAE